MSKSNTLADSVYQEILDGILDNDFPVGSRLPPEIRLCESFGASRPVVREVLARLRAEGIVESRKGSGSYVLRRTGASTELPEEIASMAEIEACYEFRIALEGECAYLAALSRTDKDVAALTSAFDAFCAGLSANKRGGINDDFQFHLAVAEATSNLFFVNAFKSIKSRIHMSIDIARRLTATPLNVRLKTLAAEHQAILAAIVDANPERARQAMRAHVANSKNRVFKGESH